MAQLDEAGWIAQNNAEKLRYATTLQPKTRGGDPIVEVDNILALRTMVNVAQLNPQLQVPHNTIFQNDIRVPIGSEVVQDDVDVDVVHSAMDRNHAPYALNGMEVTLQPENHVTSAALRNGQIAGVEGVAGYHESCRTSLNNYYESNSERLEHEDLDEHVYEYNGAGRIESGVMANFVAGAEEMQPQDTQHIPIHQHIMGERAFITEDETRNLTGDLLTPDSVFDMFRPSSSIRITVARGLNKRLFTCDWLGQSDCVVKDVYSTATIIAVGDGGIPTATSNLVTIRKRHTEPSLAAWVSKDQQNVRQQYVPAVISIVGGRIEARDTLGGIGPNGRLNTWNHLKTCAARELMEELDFRSDQLGKIISLYNKPIGVFHIDRCMVYVISVSVGEWNDLELALPALRDPEVVDDDIYNFSLPVEGEFTFPVEDVTEFSGKCLAAYCSLFRTVPYNDEERPLVSAAQHGQTFRGDPVLVQAKTHFPRIQQIAVGAGVRGGHWYDQNARLRDRADLYRRQGMGEAEISLRLRTVSGDVTNFVRRPKDRMALLQGGDPRRPDGKDLPGQTASPFSDPKIRQIPAMMVPATAEQKRADILATNHEQLLVEEELRPRRNRQ
jgi:8-oxo-dGTP pyrophosphatase MutT (NUDIX family)